MVSKEFIEMIAGLIASGQEGDYWDFKQQYHVNKADLIHDIICMANNRSGRDGYIIFGIADEPKGEVCGVELDENRRTQQQIINLIQAPKWAFGVYPSVELKTLHSGKHAVDILIIKSTADVPYYLLDDYSYTPEGGKRRVVRANHIYTRVCDTNTPIDKSAAPNQVEALWRRRFGLDLLPIEKVKQKLMRRKEWVLYGDDSTGDVVYYNKFSPEYTLRLHSQERPKDYPFYSYVQMNESTAFDVLYVMYHSTVLARMETVSLDSGRYTTPCPEFGFIHKHASPTETLYAFRYLLRDSLEYVVQEFLFNSDDPEKVVAKRNFDEVVLYFSNEEEKNSFCAEFKYYPKALEPYLEAEDEPYVWSGNDTLNKDYAKRIKVSRALKAFQKDWEKK